MSSVVPEIKLQDTECGECHTKCTRWDPDSVHCYCDCGKTSVTYPPEFKLQYDTYKLSLHAGHIPRHFSDPVRGYLDWSWNYAIAEGLKEDTTKDVARAIAMGIVRGEDVAEAELVEDFLVHRIMSLDRLTLYDVGQWAPDGQEDRPQWQTVVNELVTFPRFREILAAVKEERGE